MPVLIWQAIEGLATLTGLAVGVKSLTANEKTASATQQTADNTDWLKYGAYAVAGYFIAKKMGLLK